MNKEDKKILKALFKQKEQDALRASIPLEITDLKDLLTFLNRNNAPACDHTFKETIQFLKAHNHNPDTVVPWLIEHGGGCDCEVICNVYDEVGDIVGWHLDEDA